MRRICLETPSREKWSGAEGEGRGQNERDSRRELTAPAPPEQFFGLCEYRSLVHAAEARYVLAAMSETNRAMLEEANAAISEGNYEGFLACCADDTEWTFVGGETLKGKEAVRQWMAKTYQEPPKFAVTHMIADGDFVVALGDITSKDEQGQPVPFSYCDVWRFRGGKMVELRAFVIKAG